MPYRVDIASPPPRALDLLVQMGAIDIEPAGDGLAAIIPDSVAQRAVAAALAPGRLTFSPAVARDSGSVWLLSPRAVQVGGLLIAPPDAAVPPGTLRLIDSNAFGTGHHPTTALCVEALEEILTAEQFESVLDVGTGSGILALTALAMGAHSAVGLDIDAEALKIAADNARINNLARRLRLVLGGPDAVDGVWPLVIANILAAPLIEMAPLLVRRLGNRGWLILSGIPSSLEEEVRRAYRHLGIRHIGSRTRAGWVALIARASW